MDDDLVECYEHAGMMPGSSFLTDLKGHSPGNSIVRCSPEPKHTNPHFTTAAETSNENIVPDSTPPQHNVEYNEKANPWLPIRLPRPSITYALNQRADGESHTSSKALPQHLLDRAKEFPRILGYEELSQIGQANILILQLADRIHGLEERLRRLEDRM